MPPAQPHPIALHAVDGGRVRRARPAVLIAPPAHAGPATHTQLDVLRSVLASAAPGVQIDEPVAHDEQPRARIHEHAAQTVSLRCNTDALTLAPDSGPVRIDHVRTYRPCIRSTADALDLLLISAPPGHAAERPTAVRAAPELGHGPCEVPTRVLRYALHHARQLGRREVCVLLTDAAGPAAPAPTHTALAAEYPDLDVHYRDVTDLLRALAAGSDTTEVIVADSHIVRLVRSVAQGLCGVESLGTSSVLSTDSPALFFATDTVAEPSLEALLLVTARMLLHTGQLPQAVALSDAVLKTMEDGVHTSSIALLNPYAHRLNDAAFGRAVIDRLGARPGRLFPLFNRDDLTARPSRPPTLRLVPSN